MSYKIYLWDALDAIEWSQASWRTDADGLVLDAGCGTAKWPIYLRRLGYRCVGVEISRDACAIGRRIDPGVPLVSADGRRMPLATGSVDACLSLGVVEHDEAGPHASLLELRRVLRPGGVLVLAVPFNNLFRRLLVNRLTSLVTWRRRRLGMKLGFAEYRFTVGELRRMLRQAGFAPFATYPNDLLPPRVMGLWVDAANLVVNPFATPPGGQQFVLPGLRGGVARVLVRRLPWLVCGEVVIVARAA
jgi:SAM-dependent methyltransferase